MDKRIQIAAIVGAVMFSVLVLTSPTDPIALPKPTTVTENEFVSILAENLKSPRAIAVSENRIFITEKGGLIRVIEDDKLLESPLATFRAVNAFDGGLLGIALHPDFAENHYMYVFLTYEQDNQIYNKILQITEHKNKLQDAKTIIENIPGSSFTNGGFLKFGPDGKLYAGVGTTSDQSHLPQDLNSLAGKILRLNDDGTIPNDNPYPDSPVYSLGHRNPQGITWNNAGDMFVAELGPEKNDEINQIVSGGNYGWPQEQCNGERFLNPILCYDPSIEPGGIVFYSGNKLELESPFVMASMRSANLYQLDFEQGLGSQKSILSGVGRIRDVVSDNDGYLYLITSNTDGKGFPDSMDDKLVRILK